VKRGWIVSGVLTPALLSACVPVIAHGPRVEPGPSIGLSASLTAGPRYRNGDDYTIPFLTGPLGANAGIGWRSAHEGWPALRVGLHVPAMFILTQGDVYVQAPRRMVGGLDAGVGLSAMFVEQGGAGMPYLQVGRLDVNGSGWYTPQGYYLNRYGGEPGVRVVLREEAWVPTLAYVHAGTRTNKHAFVTVALGRRLERCAIYDEGVCRRLGRWSVAAGFTLERRRERPERRRQAATADPAPPDSSAPR
jgi:hypothetical protein